MVGKNIQSIKEDIENNIIDLITLESSGRLVVFKPEHSDKDLTVEKKGGYKESAVFFNVFNGGLSDNKSAIEKIKPEKDLYLLFVCFDIVKQNIDDNILIAPSSDLDSSFSTDKRGFIRFLIEAFEKK